MSAEEYKRTCKACGKVWHSLVSREKEILQRKQANAAQGMAGTCSPNTSATSIGTGQIIDSELQGLRKCPECGSANFEEVIVTYDEQIQPIPETTKEGEASKSFETNETVILPVESNKIPEPKKGIGCLGIGLIIIGIIIIISIISGIVNSVRNSVSDSSVDGVVTSNDSAQTNTETVLPDTSLPSGWTTQEVDTWNSLVTFYPVIGAMDVTEKDTLIESAHLVCQAYSEGYSRLEILGVMEKPSLPSGFSDDLMSSAVIFLCPEYTSIQLQ